MPDKETEVIQHIALFLQMQLPEHRAVVLIDNPDGSPAAAQFFNFNELMDAVMSVNTHIAKLAEENGLKYAFFPMEERNEG